MTPPRNQRSYRQGNREGQRRGSSGSVEATAASVDEAIIKALTELRATKDRARIEVLDEGKPKVLGLFGGRPARVRATLKGGMPGDRPERDRDRDRDRDRPRPERSDRPRAQGRGGDRPERD